MPNPKGRDAAAVPTEGRATFAPPARINVSCLGCRGDLKVHQPDDESPDRLLGTCPDCGAWHLMDRIAGGRFSLVLLPRRDSPRRAAAPKARSAGMPLLALPVR
jgi:hypothetical protein